MISNTCKYAIRAVIYISVYANENNKIGLKEISSQLDIPLPFLGKIMQTLTKHKILKSIKGPHGGFYLAKDSDDIFLNDIIEIIDGTEIFDTCLVRNAKCSDDDPCALHDSITEVRKKMQETFRNQTIKGLASEFVKDESGRISL